MLFLILFLFWFFCTPCVQDESDTGCGRGCCNPGVRAGAGVGGGGEMGVGQEERVVGVCSRRSGFFFEINTILSGCSAS